MSRLRTAFPYLFLLAMVAAVVWSNARSEPGNSSAPEGENRAGICPSCGMAVEKDQGVPSNIPGNTLRFCSPMCRDRFETASAIPASGPGPRLFDPVCKMEVNRAWGFHLKHEGTDYYFCSAQCRTLFQASPSRYLQERCPVCNAPLAPGDGLPATYLGRAYNLCSEEHRALFQADPAGFFLHRMWGIPTGLYYVSIALVLVVSFFMFEGIPFVRRRRRPSAETPPRQAAAGEGRRDTTPGSSPASPGGDRIDLFRFKWVRGLVLWRPLRFMGQLTMVVLFLMILVAGLFGNQNPAMNIAPLLTWTIWWCGLVILILYAGKAWCTVCPWDAIATWMEKRHPWQKVEQGAGLGLPWPGFLRNIWLATFLFVGLTWIELGFGVTHRPRVTAYLGIAMLLMAIVSAFLFERKSFCRYGCLVGRVSGLYAMFSGIEIRRRRARVCGSCRTRECSHGSQNAYGCPTFEYPGGMTTNTYCIQCTECLQACPHDNLAVNIRPWGSDLAARGKPRSDEAYLALLMLAITGFHGLTMTPAWAGLTGVVGRVLPLNPTGAFSVGMLLIMGGPVTVYALLVSLSYGISARMDASRDTTPVPFRDYFVRYAYCVLPIALFYHLAHNLEHLLMEGPKALALLSDPLGWGWNLFGTSGLSIPPLVSLDVLWILQVVLVATGHIYSLWAARMISRNTFLSTRASTLGQLPLLLGMIAFSIFSLWLLKQPMEMRTSAM